MKKDVFVGEIRNILDDIQHNLFARALSFRQAHTVEIDDKKQFYEFFTPTHPEKPEIHGGFALSGWCGDEACEAKIKEDLSVTIRCIPFENDTTGSGSCICCGRPAVQPVVYAKAY